VTLVVTILVTPSGDVRGDNGGDIRVPIAVINAIDTRGSNDRQPGKAGSSEKRQRDGDELAAQASVFAAGWRNGDRVMTWLHRHEGQLGELSCLMEGGWSLADIGLAMHAAGIAYRTGTPISAGLLRRKVSLARVMAEAKKAPQQTEIKSLPPAASPSVRNLPPTHRPIEDEEPEFKPASFIKYPPRRPLEASPQSAPAIASPAPPVEIDVAAVIARFIGRK